jgi:hypothetical protein
MIGALFHISKGAARDYEQKWKSHAAKAGLAGRPPILSLEHLDNIAEYIKHSFATHSSRSSKPDARAFNTMDRRF